MNKFEKIEKFARLESVTNTPYSLAVKIETLFKVGVFIDYASNYNIAKNGNSTHGLQIWFKRSDKWIKPRGWVIIHHQLFIKG